MYERVLVGTDGSETATKAVEAAALTAFAHAADLTIVHAFSVPWAGTWANTDPDVPDDLRWRLTPGAIAESTVEAAIERAHSVCAGPLVVHGGCETGRPVPVLLELIDELHADAVVVGNRDLQGRVRALRSVGRALARSAPCDVIIADTVERRARRRMRHAV